ncbi:MAG: hypothetical protein ACRC3H_01070 [Lachnospiraceae bacterium]
MDEDLMFKTGMKILRDQLEETDLADVFVLFEQVCNTNDILTFILKGYCESFQFILSEYTYAIVFENGLCRTVKGTISLPDLTFRIRKEVALDIINGRVYSAVAHMNGDVDYIGYKDGAIRFISILESFLDGIIDFAKEGRNEK